MRNSMLTKTGLMTMALAGVAVISACPEPPPIVVPAKIDKFEVTPTIVAAGGSVTASWVTSGTFLKAELFRNADSLGELTENSGSMVVADLKAGKTTIAIVISRGEGESLRQEAVVEAVTQPTVGHFTSDKDSIAGGEAVVLSWETALADKVELTASNATLATKTGEDAKLGAFLVKPTATTEYTLTATGIGGTAKAKKTVTLIPPPSFTVAEASKPSVLAGDSVTLRWTTSGATSLDVRVGVRAVHSADRAKVSDGTYEAAIDQPTVFTLVARGPGGEASKDLTVGVIQRARVTSFVAEPPDSIVGNDVTLRWDLVGVQQVQLKADGVVVDLAGGDNPAGSFVVNPVKTTVYEISGSGDGGTASSSLTVNVYGEPTIVSFASSTAQVFRRRDPAVLSWETLNGDLVSIADASGDLVDLGNQPVGQGSVRVSPNATTDYTLTLVGPGGVKQSAPVNVVVLDPVPIAELRISKTELKETDTYELSWRVEDQTSYAITAKKGTADPVPLDLSGRSATDSLTFAGGPVDTTYVLSATGPGGTKTATVSMRIVRVPKFTVLTSDKAIRDETTGIDIVRVTKGKTHTIRWETTDATGVTFDPPFLDGVTGTFESIFGKTGTVEIPITGTDDSGVANDIAFPEGFKYSFYGLEYTKAQMNMDGYLCFGSIGSGTNDQCSTSSSLSNQNIPDVAKPNNLIAAFWDDLERNADTKFLMLLQGTAPNRSLTFEWKDVDFWSASEDGGRLQIQVVLFENGKWEIRNKQRTVPTTNIAANARFGTGATIGLEGPGGTAAIKRSYNSAAGLCGNYVAGSGTTFGTCEPFFTVVRDAPPLPPAGTYPLIATANTIVKLKAEGPVPPATVGQLAVEVVDAPTIPTFGVSRTFVGAGDPITFNWTVGPIESALTKLVLLAGDAPVTTQSTFTASSLNGTFGVNPTASATYKLEVTNKAGDTEVKTVDVRVDKPEATFVADKTSGAVGDTFAFTWTSKGANSAELVRPDGTVARALDATSSALTSGSLQNEPVLASGSYKFRATNGSGTTEIAIPITIATALSISSATADPTEQTVEGQVTLKWEMFNATGLTVTIEGEATPLTSSPITAPAALRKGSLLVPVRTTATTVYRLDATGPNSTTATQSVTVTGLPKATGTLVADKNIVNWNESVTLTWTSQNAANGGLSSVGLFERVGVSPNFTTGAEVTAARNVAGGNVTVTLLRPTAYRLVLMNKLGTIANVDLDAIQVQVGAPTMQLTVSPNIAPKGGFAQLDWTATQAEKVYLWQRDPADAFGDGTAAGGNVVDKLQLPYDYRPFDFSDISRSSDAKLVTFKAYATSTSPSDNFDSGNAIIDFPVGFDPHFLGEDMGKMLVTADGVMFMLPRSAANTDFDTCLTASCASPTAIVPVTVASGLTTTKPRYMVAPFWFDLSACRGTGVATSCPAGRIPGKAYWALTGAAPNRVLIMQWDKWESWSSSYAGTLTFQVKLYENGDVGIQYKTIQSVNATFARGGYGSFGIERRGYRLPAGTTTKGANYAGALGFGTTTTPSALNLQSGDGFHFFSGSQPATGSTRTFYNPQNFVAGTPQKLAFRGTATNSLPGQSTSRQELNVSAGVDDLLIGEVMIDPSDTDDTGLEWVEIWNKSTAVVPLTGFTLQTSSGSFTFTGGQIPAAVGAVPGYVVLAQSTAAVPTGTAVVLYDGGKVRFDDAADSVVLRVGSVLVDRVEYDISGGWRIPRGRSIAADASVATNSSANDSAGAWCGGRKVGDPSATSTPGVANAACQAMEVIPHEPTFDISAATDATVVAMAVNGTTLVDDRQGTVTLAFPYDHYGTTYTTAMVSDNGFLSFIAPGPGTFASNVTLPNASPTAPIEALYPYWDDLNPGTTGKVLTKTLGTAPNRVQVVMWSGYVTYSGSYATSFLIALREAGGFEFYYTALGASATGSGATIGFEARNDSFAFLHGYNTAVLTPGAVPFGLRYVKYP